MITVTRHQATALVTLLRTIRSDWDERTTLDALAVAAHNRNLPDLAYGAIATALDPASRTPRALTFTDHEHWRRTIRTDTWAPPTRDQECATHPGGWADHCAGCRADRLAAH
ncbi:hypothetical protein [Naumannella halotolerans]|uniref:Uncharacterized protein n=1 Tax=Naumannella halotolerans TaxID=993414 RepID=A0A4R7J288_9ACTN|nr:hypothetical protein [Naumannella halotolerans]TDT31115.1 hypothetical protein CLV29_2528 [Naumannella halotolerans]